MNTKIREVLIEDEVTRELMKMLKDFKIISAVNKKDSSAVMLELSAELDKLQI